MPDEKALKFAKLASLQLDAEKAMTIVQMRSCYILLLFCDAVTTQSASKTMQDLETKLRDKDLQDRSGEADSCCMSGHEQLCRVWTSCVQDVILGKPLEVAQVLWDSGVRPVTATAKKTMKDSEGKGGAGANNRASIPDDDDEDVTSSWLSVATLLAFGSGKAVPPADDLWRLQVKIEEQLLTRAAQVEKKLRHQLQCTFSCRKMPKDVQNPTASWSSRCHT